MFEMAKVDESNRDDVVKRLKLDLLRYYNVIYGLIYEPDKATAYISYGTDHSLKGLLYIYRRTPPMVTVDGEEHTARKLMEFLPKENMILFCPSTLLNMIKSKFPEANCYPEYHMHVVNGEEHLITPNLAERLKPKNAPLLVDLYSYARPGEPRLGEQRIKELLEKCSIYGIFEAGKLISAAVSVKRLSEVGDVIGVFTHPQRRGRGFGKMVTSAATEDALKHAHGSSLFVGADNAPAIKVYEKLGYKKIDEPFWVDIGTGTRP